MTTTEHLEKIKAKCETLIANYYSESRAVAGWRSTIGRIVFLDHLREYASDEPWLMGDVGREEEEIIESWKDCI